MAPDIPRCLEKFDFFKVIFWAVELGKLVISEHKKRTNIARLFSVYLCISQPFNQSKYSVSLVSSEISL